MHVKELIKKSLDECSNIIFPKICIHCKEKASNNFFCSKCLSSLDLLEKSDVKLFSSMPYPLVVAFDEMGLVTSFLNELKKIGLSALSKIAASYMVYQYINFGYDLPDIVIPLPENVFGIKYIDVLAREIAKLMQRPVKKIFFHSYIARMQNSIFIKQTSLQDKRVLLIVDKIEEKKLFTSIENLIKQGFKDINILAFCQ